MLAELFEKLKRLFTWWRRGERAAALPEQPGTADEPTMPEPAGTLARGTTPEQAPTVERPTRPERTAMVDEPVAPDESAMVEEAPMPECPPPADDPPTPEQPGSFEQPAPPEDPATFERPTPPQQPAPFEDRATYYESPSDLAPQAPTEAETMSNQLAAAQENVDPPISGMDALREQFENLVRELAALPEKGDRLIAAGKSQAESASRVHQALTELKSHAEQGLAALNDHTQKQTESVDQIRRALTGLGAQTKQGVNWLGRAFGALARLRACTEDGLGALSEETQKQTESAERIREAVIQLRGQNEQGLGVLSQWAQQQMGVLVKIQQALDATRDPQAKMVATLEGISGGIDDLSRSSAAQTESADRIRGAITDLRAQTEQGLGALSEQAEKQPALLVRIQEALDASREPQAKMVAALEGMSGNIEDASRSSAAQAEEVRQMRQSLTGASEDLSQSLKVQSWRMTMLLIGILVGLGLLLVAVVVGIFVLR